MNSQVGRAAVNVTQADRDAVADYLFSVGWDWGACGDVREGRVAHPAVQAFAAHRLAALSQPPVLDELGWQPDFLSELRRVNSARYEAWIGHGQDAGILFDAAELGGEVGELLNVVKKLVREENGWRGSRAGPIEFDDEIGDVLICLDKLARRRGVDLATATIRKFNATSVKVDLPHRLSIRNLGGPDA